MTEYLCLWQGYPKENASWIPSSDVTTQVIEYERHHCNCYLILSFTAYTDHTIHLTQASDTIRDAVGSFTLAINHSLRKGSSREFTLHVVFRHDVYRHLFLNKKELL